MFFVIRSCWPMISETICWCPEAACSALSTGRCFQKKNCIKTWWLHSLSQKNHYPAWLIRWPSVWQHARHFSTILPHCIFLYWHFAAIRTVFIVRHPVRKVAGMSMIWANRRSCMPSIWCFVLRLPVSLWSFREENLRWFRILSGGPSSMPRRRIGQRTEKSRMWSAPTASIWRMNCSICANDTVQLSRPRSTARSFCTTTTEGKRTAISALLPELRRLAKNWAKAGFPHWWRPRSIRSTTRRKLSMLIGETDFTVSSFGRSILTDWRKTMPIGLLITIVSLNFTNRRWIISSNSINLARCSSRSLQRWSCVRFWRLSRSDSSTCNLQPELSTV